MIKCNFENGPALNGLRHVTVDGIILHNNKVLLNKRGFYNNKPVLESGKWGLIGGFVDRDETITEAFAREAMEEAGCIVTNLRLFRVKDNPDRPKEDRQNISFVMLADFVSQTTNSTEEVKELKWFSFDDLPPMENIAFDHGDDLYKYKDYLVNPASFKIEDRFPGKVI